MTQRREPVPAWILLTVLGVLIAAAIVGGILVATIGSNAESGPDAEALAIDEARFKAYQPGQRYRSLVNVTVQGRATHKDWGFKTDATLLYISEADLLREVQHNDGEELRVDLRFQTMRILEGGVDLKGIRFEPPLAAVTIFASVPLAGEVLSKGQLLNSLMDNSYVAVAVDRVLDLIEGDLLDPAFAQLEQTVAEMEGEGASLTYRRGDGLVGVRSERALSDRQEDLVRRVSVLAEARIFPDVNVAEGATWPVAAEHLAILVDPNLPAKVKGQVTFQRGPTVDGLTELQVVDGLVEFVDETDGTSVLGRWAPSGTLHFNRQDAVIARGELTGTVEVTKRSTDHILFEARFSTRPTYQVRYRGLLLEAGADPSAPISE